MERTALDKIFALQSGLYCHIHNDLLVINDREFIEKRDLVIDLDKVNDTKSLKILFNASITIAILVMTYITGFYPMALLLFVTIWDLKRIKRQTLPVLKSDCIPLKNIKKIEFVNGKLGFNELDILIENDKGTQMTKALRLYDSKQETLRALNILEAAGFKIENPLDNKNEKLASKEFVDIGHDEKLFFLDNEIVIAKSNRYPEKGEYVDANNFIFLVVTLGILSCIAAKVYLMINKHEFLWIDLLVVFMFLILLPLPFNLLNKSTADTLPKDNILKTTLIRKKKKTILLIESKGSWKLNLKRSIEFDKEEDAKKVKEKLGK